MVPYNQQIFNVMQYCFQAMFPAMFQAKRVSVLCEFQAMFLLPDIWHSLYVCKLSMRTEVWQYRGLAAQDQCDRRQSVPGAQWKICNLAIIRQAKASNEAILGMRGEWCEGVTTVQHNTVGLHNRCWLSHCASVLYTREDELAKLYC